MLGAVDTALGLGAGLALLNALYGLLVLPESLPLERRRPFGLSRANPFGALEALRRVPNVLSPAGVHVRLGLTLNGLIGVRVLSSGFCHGWGPAGVSASLAGVGGGSALVQGALVGPVVARLSRAAPR